MTGTRSDFRDHFSQQATTYAAFRPGYPDALFEWLATLTPAHDCVWDCATGNGQAAVSLARHFSRVIATDASATQIAAATPMENVEYQVATAEDSRLTDTCADLICVAQALHWFDHTAFYREAKRVAKPGGILAAWSYGVIEVEHALANPLIQQFYHETVGSYWPPERRHVENQYREIPFPFEKIESPLLAMEAQWPSAALCGYLRSWSATQRFLETKGVDPVTSLEKALANLGVEKASPLTLRWPLTLLVGRVK